MPAESRVFLDRVRATIAEHSMTAPGDRILVGVSGGPDSMALLHALRELEYNVSVAHLDHGTRDGASAEDAAFVRAHAESIHCPFYCEQVDVGKRARENHESFEASARNLRYDFFARVAREQECMAVATGHHADDQAETVLLRLARGTSPQGIAGIPSVRPLGTVRVIRPLIACARADVMAYLSESHIPFREDATNEDVSIPRNRVRHRLLPSLERDFNPKIRDALVRLADLAREDERVVEAATARFAKICLTDNSIARCSFGEGPVALQRRVIVSFARDLGVAIPFERVEAAREFVLRGKTGARLDLGEGVTIVNTKESTCMFQASETVTERVMIDVPGFGDALGKRFDVRLKQDAPIEPLREYCTAKRQVFDGEAIGSSLTVRSRKPGDRFTPLGMRGERKLQDYFVDAGVPQGDRDRVPVVETGGRIAWIVGGAVDVHFAVRESTNTFVEMEVSDAAE